MTNTPSNQPHIPQLQIDTETLLSRIANARAHACQKCQDPVTDLVTDIGELLAEVIRLQALLIQERLTSANLRAAIRAALGADADGEPDPLTYLRDELANTATTDAPHQWGRF